MDAGDAMGRGERAPLLRQISYRSFKRKPSRGPSVLEETPEGELLEDKKKMGSKAAAVVLGFECLESTAFNGISTNLVVYLETVLHGSNLASASNVTTWFGTSYLTPIFGAIIADTFWGNYNTILVSLAVYLLGMIVVTLTAFMPATAEMCTPGSSCVSGTATLPFIGLYLVAIGSGGVRSSLLPFGADQFDDVSGVEDQEGKRSFFSLFYLCVDFGPIVSGVFIVWIQQNVNWGLGFGISTVCIALAYGGFVFATPMYKRSMPTGTPLKSLFQVVVAAFRKVSLTLPFDADHLYDVSGDSMDPHARIAHTTEFRFLDRAAIISDSELEDRLLDAHSSSWTLCTVTQVEELKILLRLLPIWATSIVISAAYSQMNTTFILQGSAMDINILSVPIPAASLSSFEVLCVLAWVLLYSNLIVPALNNFTSSGGHWEPSQLQRMGAGRVLMALAMAVAALVEMKRLNSVATGEVIGIAWQLPQYFLLAGAEVFCYIAQLEFFYGEAPDSMKSMCTSLALLTIALGSYMSSLIYAVLAAITVKPGSPGWISDDLNQGHLDYFFWSMAVMCILNFAVYSAFARNYKLKTIIS